MTNILNQYKTKKILVIGGNGFIGSNITKKIIESGSNVDILTKSRNKLNTKPSKIFVGDIKTYADIKKIIQNNYDIIFHCAGYSGQINTEQNPYMSFEQNVIGTINILENIRLFSPKTKLILMGSRLEYGKPKYLPVDENHATNPISQYAIDKLYTTNYALHYWSIYHTPVTILRLSNIYGPHPPLYFQNYNVINYFLDLAHKGKNLTIYDKGKQIRDYLYIDDLIQVMLLVGLNNNTNGKIFNIGFGKPMSFLSVVEQIAKIYNVKIIYNSWPKTYKQYETGDYISNISKITSHTHWHPLVGIEEGLYRCKQEYSNL